MEIAAMAAEASKMPSGFFITTAKCLCLHVAVIISQCLCIPSGNNERYMESCCLEEAAKINWPALQDQAGPISLDPFGQMLPFANSIAP